MTGSNEIITFKTTPKTWDFTAVITKCLTTVVYVTGNLQGKLNIL